jgi:hypothetical protein
MYAGEAEVYPLRCPDGYTTTIGVFPETRL